ncbi:copper homeostasis protein CutC [Sphaerochaeta sp. PS]|uniref:copper homeostasis protein CutC n=1 Tax=Sphaerochaeta sp. PS TaxID=3076336 RepID=UPI0028A35A05|nr:copper homeostasis protein CutC [Sphaerochaeta sp. PS]MDT4761569.1 copper homeostasis protein CutC [Sphaerochaeta sp. PS]
MIVQEKAQGKVTIEICLESIESVLAAEKGGADRVEFCADLFEGGTTPSLGAFKVARQHSTIKMSVMIRPRGGDFCYSDLEFEAMKEDIRLFREAGADCVVFGILTPEGEIDLERTRQLIELARPMEVTFHRAFDMTPNAQASLETLIGLGVDRLLTSGLEATVIEGIETLAALVRQAGDRIIVMPGCGITERNFAYLDSKVKAKEYHVFLPGTTESRMTYRPEHIYMGGMLRQAEFSISHTDTDRVGTITRIGGTL